MEDQNRTAPAGFAVAGLVFGIFGLVAWLLVPVGLPVALLGLYFSIRGLKSTKAKLARLATVLCALGLFLTVSAFGIAGYVHFTGKPRILKEWMDKVTVEARREKAEKRK